MGYFAHARRGFVDALKALPKDADTTSTLAKEGRDYCNKLFHFERDFLELTPENHYIKRLEQSSLHLLKMVKLSSVIIEPRELLNPLLSVAKTGYLQSH